MLSPHRESDAIPARKVWQESARKPLTDEAIGKWRDELEPWEVALCETVLRRKMARYGYEPQARAVHRRATSPVPPGAREDEGEPMEGPAPRPPAPAVRA